MKIHTTHAASAGDNTSHRRARETRRELVEPKNEDEEHENCSPFAPTFCIFLTFHVLLSMTESRVHYSIKVVAPAVPSRLLLAIETTLRGSVAGAVICFL